MRERKKAEKKKTDKKEAITKEKDAVNTGLEEGRKTNHTGIIMLCLVISGIIFLVLMNIEKGMLENYEKLEVVVARQKIPEGLVLSPENAGTYLETKELEAAAVPANAFTSVEALYGYIPMADLDKGMILSSSLIAAKADQLAGLDQPVVAGFKAEDVSQIVCGTLRGGDIIHIYVTDAESHETTQVWENVYVEQVFDGSGAEIGNGDKVSSAQSVNILLDRENVEMFYTELARGTIRVVKEY